MKTIRKWKRTQSAIGAGVVLLAGLYSVGAAAADEHDHDHEHESVKHVLLISFDGLHEQDVARCIGSNACPNLALLARSGTTFRALKSIRLIRLPAQTTPTSTRTRNSSTISMCSR